MRFLDKGWYLLWWSAWPCIVLAIGLVLARLWLVNPIIRAIESLKR